MKKSLLFKPASSRLLVKFTVLLVTALLVMFQQNKTHAQGCTYSISLLDTWGDGWNGGAVTVNVGGTNVLTSVTLASGFGPATYNFTVY